MAAGVMQRRGARGGGRGRPRARPIAEINVTPFVDVMLVLLVIFMVAAPLLTVGVPIELPETAATPLQQEEQEPLTIAMTAEGSIMVQNSEVPRDRLVTLLASVAGERTDGKVFLRADGQVSYSDVMQVMGALNAAGFRNIGLVTDGGGPTLTEAE
ncbi:protein TolR [Rhodobacteraceae bacterium 2CG4]|uniref:Protein TolR n=1 Tax=Halovulum marinum TaxID=2662447 RepID=A0A6L5YVU0_9RHOB|nr:protein TolR [Halovulum marinum]MSU88411.1 protein TolR [Halovulum marinum]